MFDGTGLPVEKLRRTEPAVQYRRADVVLAAVMRDLDELEVRRAEVRVIEPVQCSEQCWLTGIASEHGPITVAEFHRKNHARVVLG